MPRWFEEPSLAGWASVFAANDCGLYAHMARGGIIMEIHIPLSNS